MNGGGSVTRFSESAPRPPVFPGEENVRSENQVKMDPWAARFGPNRRGPYSPSKGSPVLTPRRTTDECDSSTRRYETAEGSASISPPMAETPPYLRWAENLHFLLTDPDGVELFEKFLEQENCSHLLKFWFACEGLKRQWTEDPDRAVQIIQVIHKKYIRPRRVNVAEAVRRDINDRVANKSTLDAHIFDDAQKEVEELIRDSVYVNFLNSDVYLSYIQSMQNGMMTDSPRSGRSLGGGSDSGKDPVQSVASAVPNDERQLQNSIGPLPTLHEDSELNYVPAEPNTKPIPLTLKALMATKDDRMNVESRPVPGPYSAGRVVHNPYHMPTYYAPYNPVSRQDSEISSDAHTDDTRSLTDSSVDGSMLFFPMKPNRHQLRKQAQKMKRDCMQNRDPVATQPFIPRTHRPPPKEQQMTPQQPHEFAALLITKLENVKRERESEEKLLRIVAERDSEASGMDEPHGPQRLNRPGSECSARVLAEALSKIAPSNEADTQSILDNHVQRIWSDQTPLRSPGAPSPRPWSPENRRRMLPPNPSKGGLMTGPPPSSMMSSSNAYPPGCFQRSSGYHRRPKDRGDVEKGSTFSADSGAILDSHSSHFSSKSQQSIPDSSRRILPSGGAGSAVGSRKDYDPRVHDSGLCLHDPSAGPSGSGGAGNLMAPPPVPPKEKVLNWITHNDKWQEGDRGDSSGSKAHRSRPQSSTSPISSRKSRKQYGTSRSESQERAAAAEDRPATKPKPSNAPAPSSGLKKPLSGDVEFTVVTFTFGDEPVPYRSKILGPTVTLKQFKETCLPKKGNYKYYFKTNCEDDVALAVNQEVIDDSEILPLWDGKVLGIVKLVD